MITLYQFHRIWGLPNASPFCMKLETWLRMTKLPYETKFINNPQSAPRGKLPFIEIDGIKYADSTLIIEELKKRYGVDPDQELDQEQRAMSVLIDNVFCEHLYWILLYMRWQNEAIWEQVKPAFFDQLPALLKLFVPAMVRKKTLKALFIQGMGRHNLDEVMLLGRKTLHALVIQLGEKPYFSGTDKAASVDATAFGFLANILITPLDDSMKKYVQEFETLTSWCTRMWDEFYPDFDKPQF